MRFLLILFALAISLAPSARALDPTDSGVFVRIVDSGNGLCCVVKLPWKRYIVYDAGHWNGVPRARVMANIADVIPSNQEIDLLVLSHSDSDHLASVPVAVAVAVAGAGAHWR